MKFARFTIIFGSLLLLSSAASAAITTYNNRTTFNSSGTISFNSNFEDFGSTFSFPGANFTRGDVTYPSAQNLIVGDATPYSIGRSMNVMSYNYWSPILATVNATPQYDLLGFDVAVTSGQISVTVTTNLASYFYSNLSVPNGNPDFAFLGFEATGFNEYFTSFKIETLGQGYLPGITNVAVGTSGPNNISAVPEPTSAVFTLILLTSGLSLRQRRRPLSV